MAPWGMRPATGPLPSLSNVCRFMGLLSPKHAPLHFHFPHTGGEGGPRGLVLLLWCPSQASRSEAGTGHQVSHAFQILLPLSTPRDCQKLQIPLPSRYQPLFLAGLLGPGGQGPCRIYREFVCFWEVATTFTNLPTTHPVALGHE